MVYNNTIEAQVEGTSLCQYVPGARKQERLHEIHKDAVKLSELNQFVHNKSHAILSPG